MIAAMLGLILAGGAMVWWCERDLKRRRAEVHAKMDECIAELQKQNAIWNDIKEQIK